MRINLPIKNTEEIERIKDLYKKKNQISELLMFLLSINTGIDLAKLLNLKVKDVKKKHYLNIDRNKVAPLNQEILELIKQVTANRKDNEYLFLNSRGDRIHRYSVFLIFKDICAELGLDDKYSIISWRKTFAYHHYKKYNDLAYLMWLFNQTTVRVALKFIDIDEKMNLKYGEGVCL